MACRLPSNDEEFLNIKGVGQQKLKDFGELFLKVINDYLEEKREDNNNNPTNSNQEDNSKEDYQTRLKRIKENYVNAYESWNEEDDNELRRLHLVNTPIDEISRVLKRKPSAIRSRLMKFGVLS